MKIIFPSVEFQNKPSSGIDILKNIEEIGRTCYKSEIKITDDSAKEFVKNLIRRKHYAMIEHEFLSVRVICDRGISHEIVRHRIASYAQMSTRYCNYASGKFGGEISVICPFPPVFNYAPFIVWKRAVEEAEKAYLDMVNNGIKPEIARSVLPTCLATEIVITMNLREWRHFFSLRTSSRAHPQMKEIADKILQMFKDFVPVVFDDIEVQTT